MDQNNEELKQLYAAYGELLIQGEILNAKILDCKKRIAEKLNSNVAAQSSQENTV